VASRRTRDEIMLQLPQEARDRLAAAEDAARRSRQMREEASSMMKNAVLVSTDLGLTRREAADLLGITHQRVSQIVVEHEEKR